MSRLDHPATYAAAAAVLWVALSLLRPGVTYHLGPVIVAGAVTYAAGTSPVRAGLVGFGSTALLAGVIGLLGGLDGPDLLGGAGALPESVLGAALGAGLVALLLHRMASRTQPAGSTA